MEYTWHSIETPSVFREYRLPSNLNRWSDADQRKFEKLQHLADLHKTYIRASTYRRG